MTSTKKQLTEKEFISKMTDEMGYNPFESPKERMRKIVEKAKKIHNRKKNKAARKARRRQR